MKENLLPLDIRSFFGILVHLVCTVDSKDSYSLLPACHVPEDKSICGDFALVRYDFQRNFLNDMMWFRGSTNTRTSLTKINRALTNALHVILATGKMRISFEKAERRSSTAFL